MTLDYPRDPNVWSFFQLVSQLEREAGPGAARVGEIGPAAQETLRFRGHASLAFPTGDVTAIEARPVPEDELRDVGLAVPDERLLLTCTFLSLYGTSSPLPAAYTERLIMGSPDRSDLRDFLDFFNHRLISLLFRSWRKYRAYAVIDREGTDEFTRRLFALGGFADTASQLPKPLQAMRLLPFVGLLRMRTRSARTMAAIIGGYFRDVPVQIEELVKRAVTLSDWQKNALGSATCSLGMDFVLGDRGTDLAGKVRIWMGPLDRDKFRRFLPDGEDFLALKELVGLTLPTPLEVELALTLEAEAIPPFQIGGEAPDAMLGWSSWAGDGSASDRTVRFPLL